MKSVIKYTLIFTVILLLASCDRNLTSIYWTLEIENLSGEEITILAYDDYEEVVRKETRIPNGESITGFNETTERDGSYTYGDLLGSRSKIKVIYSDKKYEIYYGDDYQSIDENGQTRNLLIWSGYDDMYDMDERVDHIYLKYTFTEEDYQNAKPCEEECNE